MSQQVHSQRKSSKIPQWIWLTLVALIFFNNLSAQQPEYYFETSVSTGEIANRPREILYFSQQNNSHHSPSNFIREVRRTFGERGIHFESSTQIADLNDGNLARFDGVFFFGNHNSLSTDAQNSVLNFTNGGGGIVGMHVAAYSFRNLPVMRELLGGAFLGHHSISEFSPQLIQDSNNLPLALAANPRYPSFPQGETYLFDPGHPILDGLQTYTSFDEPYLHTSMNKDIVLLSYRQDHGGFDEPYTWVRYPENGRVFYHANGHDTRTWSQDNFRELMIRGTHWASESLVAGNWSYSNFSKPIISTDGQVQFIATATKDGAETSALYSAGIQSILSGASAPGNDEQFTINFSPNCQHVRSPGDIVAMTCPLNQNPTTGDSPALLIGPASYPYLVARSGGEADEIEGGFTFVENQSFPFSSNHQGQVLFQAMIEDSAGGNQKAALVLSAGPSMISQAIQGDPLPSLPDLEIVNLPEDSNLFTLDEEGSLTFAATLNDGSSPRIHIVHGTIDDFSTLEPALGLPANTSLERVSSISPLHNQTISFSATLAGAGIDLTNDQILARTSISGNVELLCREGDLIPSGFTPITLSFPDDPPQVYHFEERSIARATTSDGLTSFILVCPHGKTPHLIGREGSEIFAGGQQWTISNLDFDQFCASRQSLIIRATLSLVADPTIIRQALLHQRTGEIRAIMMEGWTIPGDTPLLVSDLEISGGPSGRSSLNEHEQLVFIATAVDGSEKIVLVQNLDDLDANGISDTIESAFGTTASSPNTLRPLGLPVLRQNSQGDYLLTYWHNIIPGNTMSYIPQMSHNLIDWVPVEEVFAVSSNQDGVSQGFQARELTGQIEAVPTFFRFKLE